MGWWGRAGGGAVRMPSSAARFSYTIQQDVISFLPRNGQGSQVLGAVVLLGNTCTALGGPALHQEPSNRRPFPEFRSVLEPQGYCPTESGRRVLVEAHRFSSSTAGGTTPVPSPLLLPAGPSRIPPGDRTLQLSQQSLCYAQDQRTLHFSDPKTYLCHGLRHRALPPPSPLSARPMRGDRPGAQLPVITRRACGRGYLYSSWLFDL